MFREAPNGGDRRFINMDSNGVAFLGVAVGYLAAYHFGVGNSYSELRKE